MRFIDTMAVVLATLAIVSINVAFIIGLYYLGTWRSRLAARSASCPSAPLIVALLVVAVKVRLSMNR